MFLSIMSKLLRKYKYEVKRYFSNILRCREMNAKRCIQNCKRRICFFSCVYKNSAYAKYFFTELDYAVILSRSHEVAKPMPSLSRNTISQSCFLALKLLPSFINVDLSIF